MTTRFALIAIAASLFAGCGGSAPRKESSAPSGPDAAKRAGATAGRGAIPLLAQWSPSTVEADMPAVVQRRLEREERDRLLVARRDASQQPSAKLGCESVGAQFPGSLGPPPPDVRPRILGHHVEVVFDYGGLGEAPVCRPALINVVVYAGAKASPTFKNSVGDFLLTGRRGRAVVELPWLGRPPYHVLVTSTTYLGRRGRATERSLTCPGTGEPVKGCLLGYKPELHSMPMPRPVLPLRGVDPPALERSMHYALAGDQNGADLRGVQCGSLRDCDVTFADQSFPARPYRVRYEVAGEQVSGCWMAMRRQALDPLPYQDAGQGTGQLAACTSWTP